jgi:hypothetical protein
LFYTKLVMPIDNSLYKDIHISLDNGPPDLDIGRRAGISAYPLPLSWGQLFSINVPGPGDYQILGTRRRIVKRREMLRAGFSRAAQVLPLALTATGSLGKLLQMGAGLAPLPEVASFPTGNPKEAGNSEDLTKREE